LPTISPESIHRWSANAVAHQEKTMYQLVKSAAGKRRSGATMLFQSVKSYRRL
jgi:hypothetical protein